MPVRETAGHPVQYPVGLPTVPAKFGAGVSVPGLTGTLDDQLGIAIDDQPGIDITLQGGL
jgi:hypothetical protein